MYIGDEVTTIQFVTAINVSRNIHYVYYVRFQSKYLYIAGSGLGDCLVGKFEKYILNIYT